MGYYRDYREAERRRNLEAEISLNENKMTEYERRIKDLSDSLKKNDTKANRRYKRLMFEGLEGLKRNVEQLKNG